MKKLLTLLSMLSWYVFPLQAVLIDAALGRDSMLACRERSYGHICGSAELKARWTGHASIPAGDDLTLVCSREGACDTEMVSQQRINPQLYNLHYYIAYRSIPN